VRHRMEVLEPPFIRVRAKRALHASVAHALTFQVEAILLFWEVFCSLRTAAPAGGVSKFVGRELASAVAQTLGYGIHGAGISAFVLALALHSQRAFDSGLRVVVAAAGLIGGLMAAAQATRLVVDGLGEGAPVVVGMFASRAVSGLWLAKTYFRLGPGGGRAAKEEDDALEGSGVELPTLSSHKSRTDPEAGEEEGAHTTASATSSSTALGTASGTATTTDEDAKASPASSTTMSGRGRGSGIDTASSNTLRNYGAAAVATTLALALVVSLDMARPSLGGALASPSYPACTLLRIGVAPDAYFFTYHFLFILPGFARCFLGLPFHHRHFSTSLSCCYPTHVLVSVLSHHPLKTLTTDQNTNTT